MMDAVLWMTGHVGSEVELKEVREDVFYATFRLASTPRTWKGGEWGDGETTWLGVTCTKALALNVKSSIGKGDPVVVVGRLRTRRWTDTQGVTHERLNIDAQAVGHDLARGTSVFRKAAKPVSEEAEPDVGELILATETQAEGEDADASAA